MKKTILLTCAVMLLLAGCEKKFAYQRELALSSAEVNMPVEGGWHVIGVYTDHDWTAAFTEEVSWATIDRSSGSGFSGIRLTCEANAGLRRVARLRIDGASGSETFTIVQAPGISKPVLSLETASVQLSYAALPVRIGLVTNLPDLSALKAGVLDEGEGSPWIRNIRIEDGSLYFETAVTQVPRTATIRIETEPSAGPVFTDLTVSQTDQAPYLRVKDPLLPAAGGTLGIPVQTNFSWSLGPMLEKARMSADWAQLGAEPFSASENVLTLTLAPNDSGAARSLQLVLPYSDIAGNAFPMKLNFTQETL